MEGSNKIKELRLSTGMNRREFCDYFDIPYRTVTEWELHADTKRKHTRCYLVGFLVFIFRRYYHGILNRKNSHCNRRRQSCP